LSDKLAFVNAVPDLTKAVESEEFRLDPVAARLVAKKVKPVYACLPRSTVS
jgi:hypothetical protein